MAWALSQRLIERIGAGHVVHHGQGKWYPGEPLPRWQIGLYWQARRRSPSGRIRAASPTRGTPGSAIPADAEDLAKTIAVRLGVPDRPRARRLRGPARRAHRAGVAARWRARPSSTSPATRCASALPGADDRPPRRDDRRSGRLGAPARPRPRAAWRRPVAVGALDAAARHASCCSPATPRSACVCRWRRSPGSHPPPVLERSTFDERGDLDEPGEPCRDRRPRDLRRAAAPGGAAAADRAVRASSARAGCTCSCRRSSTSRTRVGSARRGRGRGRRHRRPSRCSRATRCRATRAWTAARSSPPIPA